MTNWRLNRRTLLRGVVGGAGIAIGLPPLEAMFNSTGTAHADGTGIPKRLGIFFWGNGVKVDRWTPANTGAGWTPSTELEPLTAVKDYVSVVSGMEIKSGNQRGHHSGCVGILSGAPLIEQPHASTSYASTFSKPSIDQVAAAAIGATTRFRSLELGISTRVVGGEGTTLHYLSHNGPDSFNPPEYDPAKAFTRLFGPDFVPPNGTSDPIAAATRNIRRSILDAVTADIGALRQRVGTTDKMRLDQHLSNIRVLENRLVDNPTGGTAACVVPTKPASFPAVSGKEPIDERMQAMSDLLAMALACDQTRVFSIQYTGSVGSTLFWEVMATSGHHDLTHNEPGNQPLVHASTIFTMTQFAKLITALKAVPEGAGNLLDNCAILGTSDVADGFGHTITDYPILVAGKAGGALKYPGVHYRSTTKENTSNVLLTLLNSVGVTLTQFGDKGGLTSTRCTAIEV
jgi:uncharacterized protein DUF1552